MMNIFSFIFISYLGSTPFGHALYRNSVAPYATSIYIRSKSLNGILEGKGHSNGPQTESCGFEAEDR